jgi:predicted Zn-dependent peptidase
MKDVANPRTVVKGFRRYNEIAETIKFIKENNPTFTKEEVIAELKVIKKLGESLTEELCAAGKAYRKRRMAAGEKSSAYLSGRAVKVCKGQMSGRKKKKK